MEEDIIFDFSTENNVLNYGTPQQNGTPIITKNNQEKSPSSKSKNTKKLSRKESLLSEVKVMKEFNEEEEESMEIKT